MAVRPAVPLDRRLIRSVMREESARLRAAIDAIRQAYIAQAQQGRSEQPHPVLIKRLDELALGQKGLEQALATVSSLRASEASGQVLSSAVWMMPISISAI